MSTARKVIIMASGFHWHYSPDSTPEQIVAAIRAGIAHYHERDGLLPIEVLVNPQNVAGLPGEVDGVRVTASPIALVNHIYFGGGE